MDVLLCTDHRVLVLSENSKVDTLNDCTGTETALVYFQVL